MADSINTINVGGIDKEVEDTVARTSGTNANNRCTSLESNVSNLAARVEEIIAPTGEAPNPAEIVDARIDIDNAPHPTLGEAIRDQMTKMRNEYETSNSQPIVFPDGEKTTSGVTWKKVGNEMTVRGTASATNTYNYFFNTSALPDRMKPGETYHLDITPGCKAYAQILARYPSNGYKELVYSSSPTKFTIPSDATGIDIRLNIAKNTVVDETIRFVISKVESPREVVNKTDAYSYLTNPDMNKLYDVYDKFMIGHYVSDGATGYIFKGNDGTAAFTPILGPTTEPLLLRIRGGVASRLYISSTSDFSDDVNSFGHNSSEDFQILVPPGFYYALGLGMQNSTRINDLFELTSHLSSPTKAAMNADSMRIGDLMIDDFYYAGESFSLYPLCNSVAAHVENSILAAELTDSSDPSSRVYYWYKPSKNIRISSEILDLKVASYNPTTRTFYNVIDYWNHYFDLEKDVIYFIWGAIKENHDAQMDKSLVKHYITASEILPEIDKVNDITTVLSLINPLQPFYSKFGNVSPSGTIYQTRRIGIVNLKEPLYVAMYNNTYVFRLYWYDSNEVEHHTDWGKIWEIPANTDVSIFIKKKNDGRIFPSDKAELYLMPANINRNPKEYFLDEIEDTINKVRKYNTENGLAFLLSTDQHTMAIQGTLQKYDTITDMVDCMNAVAKEIRFDANISLGDIADFKWNNNTNMFDRFGVINDTADQADAIFEHWLRYAMSRLRETAAKMIYVMGNHDDNRYINRDRLQAAVSAYDYTPEEIYSYYMSSIDFPRESNHDTGSTDYYVDFEPQKIRMICLNSNYYIPQDSSSSYAYKNAWWYGFSDDTVSWLTSELQNVPQGWSVLFLCHMSSVKENNGDNWAYNNFANIKAAIQGFINGGGKVIGYFYGHTHGDWQTNSPWLEICFNDQKSENSSASYDNMPGLVHPTRTAGTATEDSWNVVLIKPIAKRIDCIRFGAGNDRFFHYEDAVVTSTLSLSSFLEGTLTWATDNGAVATVSNGVVTRVGAGRALISATDANGDTEYWSIVVS